MGLQQGLFIDSAIPWCPALGVHQQGNRDETRIEECHWQAWMPLRQRGLQSFQANATLNDLSKSLSERPIGTTLAGHHSPGAAPSQTDAQEGRERGMVSRIEFR